MLSLKADDFIDNILSHINYAFDRRKIRLELESHLADKINSYLNSGYPEEEAENMAIRDLGNAKEIGVALNKSHRPVLGWILKQTKIFALIAVLIIISAIIFNIGVNQARKQEIKRDTRTYISNMYWEINSTTNLLRSVESWNDSINNSDLSVNPFSRLLQSLNTMKNLSQSAVSYIGYTEDLGSVSNIANSFDLIYGSIGGGVTYNNRLICYDFLKDGVLSEKEIKFLVNLRDDLGAIQKSMFNEETKEYDFDISIEKFAKIINQFTYKYNPSNLTGIGLSN